MKLSNKGRYGVRALFDIAFHGEGAAAQIKDIAERQGIPQRFLEQIFQDLRRAGLVSSKRGPRGGYHLGRASDAISVGDILRALEGPLALCADEDEATQGADPDSLSVIDSAFRELSARVEACFNELTLEELCDRAQRQGLRKNAPAGYVYVI
jgi:Rrf2 family protein